MAEICADCAGSFASPTALLEHVRKVHAGGDSRSSFAMNPESRLPGVVCALCGKRYLTPAALARHGLTPHGRVHRATVRGVPTP
jgi:uncharacterized Zn-finger protein